MAPPGDARALAEAIERVRGDPARESGRLSGSRALCAPEWRPGGSAEIYGTTALHYARA